MATSESDTAPVHALEDLSGLAFELLKAVGQPEIKETKQRYLFYVAAIFKAIYLNADSVLRLHPLSVFFAYPDKPVYNPAAMAVLARMLMEGYVNLHYFVGSDVSEEEREFRCIVGDIQRVRARLRGAELLDAERAAGRMPELPPPDTAETQNLAWLAQRKRELLPDELAFWLEKLERNTHFQNLLDKEKDAWRSGRLRGYRQYGFALDRKKRCERARIPAWLHKRVYNLLAAYGHTSAEAVDRIFWFLPFDWVAIRDQITIPTTLCCGFLALAIREFLGVFSQHRDKVPLESWVRIATCAGLIMGAAPENGCTPQADDG